MGINFKIKQLYAYVMTSDEGFAPNYGLGYDPANHEYSDNFRLCTLACCKPGLRKNIFKCVKSALNNDGYDFEHDNINYDNYKKINEKLIDLNIWVIGVAGKGLSCKIKAQNKMPIYIMQINEILTFKDYYNSSKYGFKKDNAAWVYNKKYSRFDNFYTNNDEKYQKERLKKFNNYLKKQDKRYKFQHNKESDIERDLSSNYVLCSNNYYHIGAINCFSNQKILDKYISIVDNIFKLFIDNDKGRRLPYPPSISESDSEEHSKILEFFSWCIKNEWSCFYRKTYNELSRR